MEIYKMENRIKKILSEVFDRPLSLINENISTNSIAAWDSMKHIELIMALEKEFKITFDNDEIPSMINLQIIIATIGAYQ
jgi:acyl carrier protein